MAKRVLFGSKDHGAGGDASVETLCDEAGAFWIYVDNNHHVAGKDMCVGFLFQDF
jgi:hypothetical protein